MNAWIDKLWTRQVGINPWIDKPWQLVTMNAWFDKPWHQETVNAWLDKPRIEQVSIVVISLALSLLFTAIILDFGLFSGRNNTVRERKSIVETGSMLGFFLFDCLIVKSGWGRYPLQDEALRNLMILSGDLMILAGAAMNLAGRIYLGANWANQIKIYTAHTLIRRGPYRWVRHPLYASIILMFYGGVLIFQDGLSFAAVSFLFVPFMAYRARQEEQLLQAQFSQEYAAYRQEAGMFTPKFYRRRFK